MGIAIKYHHPEVGAAGQFEIEPMLGQMSKMADASMMIKYVVHNTDAQHGHLTANYLIEQSCGSTLRLSCRVSVDIHRSEYQQSSHIGPSRYFFSGGGVLSISL